MNNTTPILVAYQGYTKIIWMPNDKPINGRTIRRAMTEVIGGITFVTEFSWMRHGSGRYFSCKRLR